MTDPTPILDDGSDLPEVVSVTIKPEALTSFEEWRMVLVRLAPRSRRPALIRVIVIAYLLISFGTLGYIVGTQGSPGLNPVVMALAGSGVGLLYMVRLWSVKTVLIKGLRELGSVTIELRRESATIRSKHRVTRLDWAGVREMRTSPGEIVLAYRAGDVSWIPTRAFADPEHEARFLAMAGYGLAAASLRLD
jgi:hypothetical protein